METEPRLSLSPILSSYSSDNLTEIAARVVQELTAESDHSDLDDGGAGGDFEFTYEGESNYPRIELENHADELNRNEGDADDVDEDEDDDFEFVVAGKDAVSSPISADEVFCNGQIRPIYPVFNRNLFFDGFGFVRVGSNCEKPPLPPPIPHPPRVRIPLGKLMREDRDPPSSSSSEADELDGIPAEIYCIWKPKTEEELSSEKCKKSNSLGSSSKRWKFRNLLHRSSSEGKDMLVFIPPTDNRGERNVDKPEEKESKKEDEAAETERSGDGGEAAAAAVDQRTKATRVGERKASYLPYRKDLVGLFSNLHPF